MEEMLIPVCKQYSLKLMRKNNKNKSFDDKSRFVVKNTKCKILIDHGRKLGMNIYCIEGYNGTKLVFDWEHWK